MNLCISSTFIVLHYGTSISSTLYNEGYGLKLYPEECIEALNKHLHQYRNKLARRTSFSNNVTDVFIGLKTPK